MLATFSMSISLITRLGPFETQNSFSGQVVIPGNSPKFWCIHTAGPHTGHEKYPVHRCSFAVWIWEPRCLWLDLWLREQLVRSHQDERDPGDNIPYCDSHSSHRSSAGLRSGRAQAEFRGQWNNWCGPNRSAWQRGMMEKAGEWVCWRVGEENSWHRSYLNLQSGNSELAQRKWQRKREVGDLVNWQISASHRTISLEGTDSYKMTITGDAGTQQRMSSGLEIPYIWVFKPYTTLRFCNFLNLWVFAGRGSSWRMVGSELERCLMNQ